MNIWMSKLLFDASSLIYALKLKKIDLLYGSYVQQLTIYEALNAIWKETYLTKTLNPEETNKIIDVIKDILEYVTILTISTKETRIFEKAIELGITVYDASYIVLAEENNLTLVTEDNKLKEKAEKIVKTKTIKDLVKTS